MDSPTVKCYNLSRSFFNKTLGHNWDMELTDRSFDPVKVQEYLSLLEEPDRSFVRELPNKTMYVRYPEFKEALMSSFEMFKKEIGDKEFYLFLPTEKIGSEHWLVALLWPQLRTMKIKEIINEKLDLPLETQLNIVIIDDASYTGINTFAKLDEISSTFAEKVELDDYLDCLRESNKNITYHVVIPFISKLSEDFLMGEFNSMGIRSIIYKIKSVPRLRELIDVGRYYHGEPEKVSEILRDRFGVARDYDEQYPLVDMPMIYFDHKVASDMSTFSSIYLEGRLPNGSKYGSLFRTKPSRANIEKLERQIS